MKLLLTLLILLEVYQVSNGCKCLCSICAKLPMTQAPASAGTATSPGIVTESIGANGCKQYVVTCYAMGNNYVVMGANQKFIPLTPAGPGAKYAILNCGDDEKIKGTDINGNALNVDSVYCAYAVAAGK
uniref:Uncharacterized protein n=1 Tax=Panagrolaimus sp. ES5 TaxID=591445 RepID=A0AC34FDX1_9BILA